MVPKSSRDDNFNKPSEDLSTYRYVRVGDLVLNKMKTWQGSLAVSDFEGIVSPAYIVCELTGDVFPRYLHYLLRSQPYVHLYQAMSKGIRPNQWDLPYDEFRTIPALLPPLGEQRRIADFLDAEVGRIDVLSGALQRALQLLEERVSACMELAFGGVPEQCVPLRRIIDRWIDYRGSTPAKTTDGVPLVTAKNISRGAIDLAAAPEYISVHDYDDWMRRGLPRAGDVLLTTEAPLGEVAMIADSNVALAQRVILMRVRDSVDPHWLYWYLRSPVGQSELYKRATGSTALGIKADRLYAVPIPIFGRDDMRTRLKRLTAHVEEAERLRKPISRQQELLAERKRSLISAAVTGHLEVSSARRGDAS